MTIDELIAHFEKLAVEAEQRADIPRYFYTRYYQCGLRDAYRWAAKLLREAE